MFIGCMVVLSLSCVGLALVLQLYRRFETLDTDAASEMKG